MATASCASTTGREGGSTAAPGRQRTPTGLPGRAGALQVFALRDGSRVGEVKVADDTVNGCSIHPLLPLLATASGHRRYPLAPEDSDGEGAADGAQPASPRPAAAAAGQLLPGMRNALRVHQLQASWVGAEAAEEAPAEEAAAGTGGEAEEAAAQQMPAGDGMEVDGQQAAPYLLSSVPVVQV